MTTAFPIVRETEYRDDGCDVHPACLSCPLPRCKYDAPANVSRAIRSVARSGQREQAIALRGAGNTTEQIAAAMRISPRTVQRLFAEVGR